MKEKGKFDLVSVLGVMLCVGLLLWSLYSSQKRTMEYQKALEEQRLAALANPSPTPDNAAVESPAATPNPGTTANPPPAGSTPPTPELPEQTVEFSSTPRLLDLDFTTRGGGIKLASLVLDKGVGDHPVELNTDGAIPIGSISRKGETRVTQDYNITAQTANSVTFQRVGERGLEIVKTFTLPENPELKDRYVVELDVAFTNKSAETYKDDGYLVYTGSAQPIHSTDQPHYEGFDYNLNGKVKEILTSWFDPSGFLGFQWNPARETFDEAGENIRWAAVKNQFYVSMILPVDATGSFLWAKRIYVNVPSHSGPDKKMPALEGALGMPGLTLAPQETTHRKFRIYMGPKAYSQLKALGSDATAILKFWPFEFVSVFLLSAMKLLSTWLWGSYGMAIIVLTIGIKLCLWPLQSKSMRSMKEMAALAPKITELREKYKDDPARANQEAMALYKQYGVNPMAGCLPLFVQIPIFLGFYSMLGTAVELRNSRFFWVQDLTQPDTIFTVLGFPVNLLPLLMAATMLWQMSLTPKTGDKMQQRIFMFMPLIFIFFCYNYASALPLYWSVQNIFSIVQIYLTRDKPVPPLKKKTPEPPPGKGKKKKRN